MLFAKYLYRLKVTIKICLFFYEITRTNDMEKLKNVCRKLRKLDARTKEIRCEGKESI